MIDFRDRMEELEASENPVAFVVLAHLKTLETRKHPKTRVEWKIRLMRSLAKIGFDTEKGRLLLRVIDRMMNRR